MSEAEDWKEMVKVLAGANEMIDEYDTEIERLRKQCDGLAQAAMNNGQSLLLAEALIRELVSALERIRKNTTGSHLDRHVARGALAKAEAAGFAP